MSHILEDPWFVGIATGLASSAICSGGTAITNRARKRRYDKRCRAASAEFEKSLQPVPGQTPLGEAEIMTLGIQVARRHRVRYSDMLGDPSGFADRKISMPAHPKLEAAGIIAALVVVLTGLVFLVSWPLSHLLPWGSRSLTFAISVAVTIVLSQVAWMALRARWSEPT